MVEQMGSANGQVGKSMGVQFGILHHDHYHIFKFFMAIQHRSMKFRIIVYHMRLSFDWGNQSQMQSKIIPIASRILLLTSLEFLQCWDHMEILKTAC